MFFLVSSANLDAIIRIRTLNLCGFYTVLPNLMRFQCGSYYYSLYMGCVIKKKE